MKSAVRKSALHIEASPRPAEVILVAVGLCAESAAALRWASTFARALGLQLRLVHAASERLPVDPLFPMTASRQRWHRERWIGSLLESLQDWAQRETNVLISLNEICMEFGDPAALILREAARPDVRMVVLGGVPSESPQENAPMRQELVRRCPRPILFVGPQGRHPVIVAATDCSDPALPVLQEAWRMAAALGDQIFLVHNVDQVASQFAARVGVPLTPALANGVEHRSQEWLEKTAGVGEVIITREKDRARAVLGAARSLGADLLVVGVKPEGATRHGTAEQILMQVQRSVLFVPVAGRAAPALASVAG